MYMLKHAGGDLVSSKDCLKLLLVLSCQLDVESCHVLLQVVESFGTWNWENILPLQKRQEKLVHLC